MKKTVLFLAMITSFLAHSQNLILNPSAELPMVNGEIPNWTETIGDAWISYDDIVDFNFEANTIPDGTFWFYAQSSVQNIDGITSSELEQTIDINNDATAIDLGTKNYFFSGFVRSYEQGTNDQSNVFIQFFDANNVLLTAFNFGPYSDASAWNNINGTLLAPINSRKIKIKLHSIRRTGTSNDAVYDDLYIGSTPTLGVSENAFTKSSFIISPNPSNGVFTIQCNTIIEKSQVTVFDCNGRIVQQTKLENFENKTLDLTHLKKGLYLINIANESSNYTQKIIKL